MGRKIAMGGSITETTQARTRCDSQDQHARGANAGAPHGHMKALVS
ncbi:MAG: hypothetical protein ACLSAC_18545 [Enterocloster bolteae]